MSSRFTRGQSWGAARALLEKERQNELQDDRQYRQQHPYDDKKGGIADSLIRGGVADALLGMTTMAVSPYVSTILANLLFLLSCSVQCLTGWRERVDDSTCLSVGS